MRFFRFERPGITGLMPSLRRDLFEDALPNSRHAVEFSDDKGKTYAELALAPDQLLVLHHRPQRAA